MARLTPGEAGDRGQLMLVAAVFIGVLLVVLAMVLNAVVFTGVTAGRDEAVRDARAAERHRHESVRATGALVAAVNRRNDTSHAALWANLSDGLGDHSRLRDRHAAMEGRSAGVELAGVTNGTRLRQPAARNLTNASGAPTWTLAADVTATRDFELELTGNATATPCSLTDCFRIEITDGTDTWRLAVNQTVDGRYEVLVDDGGGWLACETVDSLPLPIDFENGTVAGTACPSLRFEAVVDGDYAVSFVNGDTYDGTYELLTDNGTLTDAHPNYDGGGPTVSPAVYAATVTVTFESRLVAYRTTVRVVPGDGDG